MNSDVILGDEKDTVSLLNSTTLHIHNKEELIFRKDLLISNINEVNDETLWPYLLDNNKVTISWNNLLLCFGKDSKVKKSILNLINTPSVLVKLIKDKDNLQNESFSSYIALFIEELLTDSISLEAFSSLAIIFENELSKVQISDVNFSKIIVLIECGIIKDNEDAFFDISEYHPELIAKFVEYNFNEVNDSGKLSGLKFAVDDMALLLGSEQLNNQSKLLLSGYFDQAIETIDAKLFNLFTDVYLHDVPIEIPTHILNLIINYSTGDIKRRVELLAGQVRYISKSDTFKFMKSLGYPYSGIASTGSFKKIENTKSNMLLAKALESEGYFSISNLKYSLSQIRLNLKGKHTYY